MSFTSVEVQQLIATSTELGNLREGILTSTGASANSTNAIAAAAADEISLATAQFFNSLGKDFHAALGHATAIHKEFELLFSSASASFVRTEATSAASLTSALATSPIQSLVARIMSALGMTIPATTVGTPVTMPLGTTDPTTYGTTLIMTGSGTYWPTVKYMTGVAPWIQFHTNSAFLTPLGTPEGLYPTTGIKDLPADFSMARGIQGLYNTLFGPAGFVTNGQNVTVLGYSQSSGIISNMLQQLVAQGSPGKSQLSFTLLGDPSAPNGGFFTRFPGFTMAALGGGGAQNSLGNTPTPVNSGYHVNVFSQQYDGITDLPRYPINILSDLNAIIGIVTTHSQYPDIITASGQLTPGHQMIELPVSPTTAARGLDHYYMITSNDLPLLDPLRAIPIIGKPLADLLQPNLTYLVNLGYGNPNFGFSTSYADVVTPFGGLPPIPADFFSAQLALAGQGLHAFTSDISAMLPTLPSAPFTGFSLPDFSLNNQTNPGISLLTALSGLGTTVAPVNLPTLTLPTINGATINGFLNSTINNLVNANSRISYLAGSISTDIYSIALPTADLINGAVVSLPSYDVTLFLQGIQEFINGDPAGLVNAIIKPIAVDTAMYPLQMLFFFNVLGNQIQLISDAISGNPLVTV